MVDTNVLIYASDPAAGDKRTQAQRLIQELIDRNGLVVSVQVLNEFYNATTRPNKPPSLAHEDARSIIEDLIQAAEVVPLTEQITLRALDGIPRHGLSFWDALVWAAAKENGVPVLYTEDFQAGRDLDGVRFVNPFV